MHFSVTKLFTKVNAALCFIASGEDPICIIYVSGSATHEVTSLLKNARSVALILNTIFSDCPDCNNVDLAKASNSSEGLSTLPEGTVM